jgi:hypothetical protein
VAANVARPPARATRPAGDVPVGGQRQTTGANALTSWNIHYNYRRPHTAVGNRPPTTRLHTTVAKVMTAND